MEQLILVRHGATRANLDRPYWIQGKGRDEPLVPVGLQQAQAVRDYLRSWPITAVVTSPLQRARRTAEIVAEPHGLEVRVIESLHEGDVGRWEGRTWDEIQAADPEEYARFTADPGTHGYPGGENFSQVAARVVPLLSTLLETHAGQSVVVVGHQITHRAFLGHLLGIPAAAARRLRLDNGGVSLVRRAQGQHYLQTLNFTQHVDGIGA
ncbi:MAG TPA: histidine phosphatase family protein [Gemmatales bacterium]|nr:histidine phosphatase family protein [Gemmatales bacterium]HMP58537.1 histidine phosphatase family protein [Gemmatales bacterium]